MVLHLNKMWIARFGLQVQWYDMRRFCGSWTGVNIYYIWKGYEKLWPEGKLSSLMHWNLKIVWLEKWEDFSVWFAFPSGNLSIAAYNKSPQNHLLWYNPHFTVFQDYIHEKMSRMTDYRYIVDMWKRARTSFQEGLEFHFK